MPERDRILARCQLLIEELQTHFPRLRPLWPYQVPAFNFVSDKDTAGLYMDKRLGKCPVSIRWALARGARRILVVAPLSACGGWLNEIELDGLKGCLMWGTPEERLQILVNHDDPDNDEVRFFIVNPQGLFTSSRKSKIGEPSPSEIALLDWDAVIWDECTNLKNPQSQTNQVAHACFADVSRRMILSGEPAPEGALDLFEQLRWLNGGHFMGHRKFWSWRTENFNQAGYEWFPKPGKLTEIKKSVDARCFTLSRKDAKLGHVPPTYERREIELPAKIRKAYDKAELHFELPKEMPEAIEFWNQASSVETKYAVVVDNWLAQLCGGYPKDFPGLHSSHKMDVLLELLKETYANEQVVVAFRFNSELYAAAEALKTHKIFFSALTGAVPPPARRAQQNAFNAGRIRVLLAQIRVLQFGIDLSASRTMIRYSLPPAYEIISQSQDRIIHAMKTDPVAYIDLCVKDSVDEDLLEALGEKKIEARFFVNKIFDIKKLRTEGKKVTQ